MNTELELIKFLRNAEEISVLSLAPYCLSISTDNVLGRDLIMFKYSQIESDFNNKLVREARGIVLDANTYEVVSYAFDKFGNIGESYCPNIDAGSMKITEKVDGSIIKIVKLGNDILISTNGTIDAFKAGVAPQIGCTAQSFGDLVMEVIVKKFGSKENFVSKLHNGLTYIFELVSPWTRVVIPYQETDLYLIGCRDNNTYAEIGFYDCDLNAYFKTPKIYNFGSIEDCMKNARELPWDEEGYVVMDSQFNRVKVKSVNWLAAHHLCNNHNLSYSRAIELVRNNELDEILSYFPEFKDALDEVKTRYEAKINGCKSAYAEFSTMNLPTRKDQAIWIMKNFPIPGVGFALLDKKVASIDDWFLNVNITALAKMLGYKE